MKSFKDRIKRHYDGPMEKPRHWRDIACPSCGAKVARWCFKSLYKQKKAGIKAGMKAVGLEEVPRKDRARNPHPCKSRSESVNVDYEWAESL